MQVVSWTMASELLPLSIGTSQMEIRVQKAYCDPSFGNIDILAVVRNVSSPAR